MSPTLSLTAWQVILTIFHTLAITSTTFRLWRRYTTRKLWWDDFWAFVALVVDLLFFASVWLRWEVPTGANTVPPQGPLLRRITLFWLSALLTPCVAWPARVSMCMSISRLAPPTARRRRALFALAVVFLLLGAVLTAQKIWICAGDSSWHQNPAVQCYTGKTVGYLSLSTDVVGDACLVAIPLRLLWGVKLPRRERRLVLSLFASSILSTLAGIVYAVFIFRAASFGSYRTLFVNMTAHIKAAVTLLVCNLLVIVTYIYRKLNTEGLETEDETEEESRIGVTTPPPEEKSESVQTPPPGEEGEGATQSLTRSRSAIFLTPISSAHFSSRNTSVLMAAAANSMLRDTSTFCSMLGSARYGSLIGMGTNIGTGTGTGMESGRGRYDGSRAISWVSSKSKSKSKLPPESPG